MWLFWDKIKRQISNFIVYHKNSLLCIALTQSLNTLPYKTKHQLAELKQSGKIAVIYPDQSLKDYTLEKTSANNFAE